MRFETHYGLGAGNTLFTVGGANITGSGITQAFGYGSQVANQTGNAIAGAAAGGLSMAASIFAMSPVIAATCPPCGAVLAIGAALVPIVMKLVQGCGQSCIEASDAANQIEPLLVQNVSNYVNAPIRYKSLQAAALANFDQTFAQLVQRCQQVGGAGGTNCVKDRVAGACKWKASAGAWAKDSSGAYHWTPAGPSGSGSTCWNWVVGYRDPIANDPGVVPDPEGLFTGGAASDPISQILNSLTGGGSSNTLLLVGAGLLALYLMGND